MSVYVLASRLMSVEYTVDELGRNIGSANAVLSGTTTIQGLAFLCGPVALGSSITGIDISDVAGLQTALDRNVDNAADANKPVSTATQTSLDAKADKTNTYTKTMSI